MIPKIVHYCWLSGDPYPNKINKCLESWKQTLPDYNFILWDTVRFNVDSVRWVKEAYSVKKYAFASDYIRFFALYNYGGIYLDTDVEVIKNFNDLLACQSFMGFEYSGLPEAAVIGAQVGCEWIGKCLNWYEGESFFDKHGKYRETVVPLLVKKIYEKEIGVRLLDSGDVRLGENSIYPYQYFSPKNPYTGKINISPVTYVVHHFESAWQKKSFSVKIRKIVHLLLLLIIGKKRNDVFMYLLRGFRNKNEK